MNLSDIESLERRAKRHRDLAYQSAMSFVQRRKSNPEYAEKLARSAEGYWQESFRLWKKIDRVSQHLFGHPWHSAKVLCKEEIEARRQKELNRKKK